MNHTLLQNPFQLEYPASSDNEYIGSERVFSDSTAFPTEDVDEQRRRVGSLGNSLTHPVSVPVTGGLRYTAQHSAVQDVPFQASSGLLMSPADSCSGSSSTSQSSAPSSFAYTSLASIFPGNVTTEAFHQTQPSVYSHPTALQWNERMGDYRPHRVPALQPPSGMSPPMQSQNTVTQASAGLLGRTDSYSAPYAVHRSTFSSPHSGYNEMSRYSQYTANSRGVDTQANSSPGAVYNHSSNMLVDVPSRATQSVTDAPPFNETIVLHSIVINNNTTIKPEIQAKIHKGFFQVDEKWTCYRRNYFSVSCSFSLRPWIPNVPLYLQLPNHTESIRSFSMSISAVVNTQDNEIRELVQHTPKRDKQSERKPGKVTLQPNQPPPLVLNHGSVSTPSHLGFGAPPASSMRMDYNHAYPTPPQPTQPPTQHTFERIQFQKATANNGKRRAQQQYYNLVVELYAEISNPIGNGVDAQWVKIAKRLSHPMVVRGRSPGHYKDGRRDSSTSMGPDGGAGSSGDPNGGASLHGLGHASRSHLPLMPYDPTQRGSSQYGRGDYRQMATTEHSGSSESPLVSSSSSSSGFEYTMLGDSINPMETVEDVSTSKGYCEDAFPESSQGVKMEMQPNNIRMQSLKYDYDALTKSQEIQGARYSTAYEPVVPSLHSNQESQLQYFKRTGSDESLTQPRRQTPGHGYGAPYPRDFNEKGYGRLDAVPTYPGLCS